MRKLRSWKLWAVVGGIIIVLIVIASVSGSGSDGSDNRITSQPSGSTPVPAQATEPSPTPAPAFTITAQQLYEEREANATRYDATYKGKLVRVSGEVVKIDRGDVTLGVDPSGFGMDKTGNCRC